MELPGVVLGVRRLRSAALVIALVLLVDAGMMKVAAQAIAIVAGMPLSFIGQKLWSFKA